MIKQIKIVFLLSILLLISCAPVPQEPREPSAEELMESAKLTGERFARYIEQENWGAIYGMLHPELKAMNTKEAFIENLRISGDFDNAVMRVDRVLFDTPKAAYLYSTYTIAMIDSKMPAIKMTYVDNTWYFDTFSYYLKYDQASIARSKELIAEAKANMNEFAELALNAIARGETALYLEYTEVIRSTADILPCGRIGLEQNIILNTLDLAAQELHADMRNLVDCFIPAYADFEMMTTLMQDICNRDQWTLGSWELQKLAVMDVLLQEYNKDIAAC